MSEKEKELVYFTYNKNATNLGNLYFSPKFHKRSFNFLGIPVMSNWNFYQKSFRILGFLS